jgi:Family of unknown function (DUF5719)
VTDHNSSWAKEMRASIALLLFIIAAHVAHLLPQTSQITEVTQSYPATACPGPIGDAKATALLPNKNVGVRDVARAKAELWENNQGSYSITRGAILVAGNPSNTITLQSRAGKWTSAATCTISDSVVWFVGGTADVTSQSKIVLVNSGLSDAVVDITSFSENGESQPLPATIKASSDKTIRIDSLDPGASHTVIQVKTRSGRVTAYLLDERVKGLNNVGADFVAPVSQPSREVIISGLPVSFGNGSKVNHRLRLLTTGKVDATASVEVLSPTGVFIPVGFGGVSLSPSEVKEVSLSDVDLGKKTFALKIVSTEPIVAGVFTEVKKGSISDFMWSSGSQPFGKVSFNLYGLEPRFTFVGERVQVVISWRTNSGKTDSKVLVGEEIVSWKVPPNLRLVTISNRSGAVASLTWMSNDGVTHLPLNPSTNLESATKPLADVTVIQPKNQ